MERIRLGIQTCLAMVLLFSVVRPAFGGWVPDIPGLAPGQNPPEHPDYTLGESMPAGSEVIEQNLGPTGAHGKMWGWKQRTDAARQILITDVENGSPAAEKITGQALLKAGDVILGIGGNLFTSDARKALANAITALGPHSTLPSYILVKWTPRNG